MRWRWVQELDSLIFSFPKGSRTTLDNELGSDGSHGEVRGDGALVFGLQLGSTSFHFSSEGVRPREVVFMRMRAENALLLLLSLWTVCMGGVDGGAAHSVGLGDMTRGVSIDPLRSLDFLDLLRP